MPKINTLEGSRIAVKLQHEFTEIIIRETSSPEAVYGVSLALASCLIDVAEGWTEDDPSETVAYISRIVNASIKVRKETSV